MAPAISFLEVPLNLRAPDVTLQIGRVVGRVVFRALNAAEVGFAVVLLIAIAAVGAGARAPARIVAPYALAFAVPAIQLLVLRPRLTRRGYCY